MNWFRKLFARSSGARNSVEGEEDIVTGWILSVSMSRGTPLAWLVRHGEVSKESQSAPPGVGIWRPKLKSWRDLGFDIDELPKSTMASEIGPIPEDGGSFLPFLIRYREIIEGDAPWEQMLDSLAELEKDEPEISGRLDGLVQYVIAQDIGRLPGAGKAVTEKLMGAGYRSADQVRAASIDELCKIDGIGKAIAGKLKSALPNRLVPKGAGNQKQTKK